MIEQTAVPSCCTELMDSLVMAAQKTAAMTGMTKV